MRADVAGAFGFLLFVKNIAFLHHNEDILAQREEEKR
jgi:hypothetical protein